MSSLILTNVSVTVKSQMGWGSQMDRIQKLLRAEHENLSEIVSLLKRILLDIVVLVLFVYDLWRLLNFITMT